MGECDREEIKKLMNENPELRKKLYARGFLFTDDEINEKEYPFYNLWKKEKIGKNYLLVHPKQHFYIKTNGKKTIILIGHAYNPFSMCAKEETILDSLLKKEFAEKDFWDEFHELSGIFTVIYLRDNKRYVIGDAACMQTTFYGSKNGHIYVSSHTNILGDLLDLKWDTYIKELSSYKFFSMLGNALPGDLTQYKEIKRLTPNHYVEMKNSGKNKVARFYYPKHLQMELSDIAKEAGEVLHKNMKLIQEKWEKPAISMTGGCDSKTTLACAQGLYENFCYFSYISSEAEEVDAKAAHKICNTLNLKHNIYKIPRNDSSFHNIEAIRKVLLWNTGDITENNKNDVRKRAFFSDTEDFDVEVKSWASEIGRAYYSKRFNGRTAFGSQPTPRKCTTMYKFFFHNRRLVRKTDKVFEKYLEKYFAQADECPLEWQEQFFWEYRMPSWNGLVITGEHRYSFDITIPYNNRRLLELLVSAPIDDRIHDTVYKKIREYWNPEIDKTGIAVTNLKHTKNREKAENVYYTIHSKIPF